MPCRYFGILALAGILAFAPGLSSQDNSLHWRKGKVLAAELNGHGASPGATPKRAKANDIWWTYCIAVGDSTYSAALRENPSRSGLAVNNTVRVAIQKNRLYVLDPHGRQLTLSLVRQGKAPVCR